MAAFARLCRPRQIIIEVRIDRTGYMAGFPGGSAGIRLEQVEAAIDDNEVIAAEPRLQLGYID